MIEDDTEQRPKFIVGSLNQLALRFDLVEEIEHGGEQSIALSDKDLLSRGLEIILTKLDDIGYDFVVSLYDIHLVFKLRREKKDD